MDDPTSPEHRNRRRIAGFCRLLLVYQSLDPTTRACIDNLAAGLFAMSTRDREASLDEIDELLRGTR